MRFYVFLTIASSYHVLCGGERKWCLLSRQVRFSRLAECLRRSACPLPAVTLA